MKKRWIPAIAGALLLSVCLAGCQEKEVDEASMRVMELTITPRPTATPMPIDAYPKAIATTDDITMINTYLVDHGKGQ